MIAAIPNQPLNFLPIATIVDCPDKRIPLIADDGDTLRFQFAVDAPSGAGPYGYGNEVRDWDPNFDWSGEGAWVNSVNNGLCAVEPGAGGYIQPFVDVFAPTIGVVYQVVVDLPSISSTSTFSMGGQSFVLSAPGSVVFLIMAATTDGPRITLDNAESLICVERVRIFEVIGGEDGCVVTVELVDSNTQDVVFTINSESDPEFFTIGADNISVTIPLAGVADIEGRCFYIKAYSSCDEGGVFLCSQPVKVGDCGGTLVLRVCLDHDAMGFDAPAVFEVRVKASLVRPRFEYDVSEERWSDGTINRYYVDRQRTMELGIQPVDESLHPFLAALCMFDHVYVDGSEYSVDTDGYEPAYGEGTGTAAVSLMVRAQRELMRRTTCDAAGPGCSPANDPICNIPNVTLTGEYAVDGTYRILVALTSMFGFVTAELIVTVDDAPDAPIAFGSAPDSVEIGPYVEGQVILITITNALDPSCDYTFPRIVVGESPNFVTGGLNNEVNHIRVLSNGLIIISGGFTLYDTTSTPYFTALNPNGTLNGSFNSGLGSGFDIGVGRFEIDSSGRIVVGGGFTEIDGTSSNRIARINPTGLPDLAFSAAIGTGFAGPGPGAVADLAISSGGTIFLVGQFTSFNGTGANRVLALLPTGLINTSFVYGAGFDSAAERIVIAPDGTLLVSSRFFTFYDGTQVKYGFATIVRLNASGTLNSMALHASGTPQFNATVRDIAVQPDGKILVFGGFTSYDGVAVGRMVRLNADFTLDAAFNANLGAGFDTQVETGYVQPNGQILVCADGNLDGVATNRLVRLNTDGTRDMSFNAVAPGFDGGLGAVYYDAGTILAGGFYTHYNGALRKYINRIP